MKMVIYADARMFLREIISHLVSITMIICHVITDLTKLYINIFDSVLLLRNYKCVQVLLILHISVQSNNLAGNQAVGNSLLQDRSYEVGSTAVGHHSPRGGDLSAINDTIDLTEESPVNHSAKIVSDINSNNNTNDARKVTITSNEVVPVSVIIL